MKRHLLILILAAAALAAAWAVPAEAAQPVPRDGVIAEPGAYRLEGDRSGSGARVIEVRADGVTLDLGGHTVACTPDDPATAVTFGVYAYEVADLVVRDGAITNCMFGLRARRSTGTVVERVDFTANRYIGVDVTGTGARIRLNRFADIRGYEAEACSIGINGVGSHAVVRGNVFLDLYRQDGAAPEKPGEGVAILIAARTEGNVVHGNWIENGREGDNIGIWAGRGGGGHVIRRNAITGMPRGIAVDGRTTVRIVDNRLWLRGGGEFLPIVGEAVEQEGNLIVQGDAVYRPPEPVAGE